MKLKHVIQGGFLTAAGGLALAVNFGEKPDTPQLPGVEWVVHDGTRPQPRKVATQGAVSVAPPADAKVLLGADGAHGWTNEGWKVEEGVMTVGKKSNQTKDQFRDFQMHVEWRIPADRKVNGQQGGNSGLFLMGRYEVQVLACYENKTYPDGQAGGMYGQYPPLVNASAPKGEWNSYDIVFKAPRYEGETCVEPAKLTLFHNGVLLHNAKEYLGPTQHKKLASYPAKHPERGPISIQDHGDPIQFRNIWIRETGEYDQP
ncbi:MAG: 3-keto-disaccharide hydrolase [Verrucomicrobiaceae bacterium]